MNLCNAIITMMKFTRYIVVLVSLVVTMCGCVDESEQLTVKTSVDGNTITITGRITAFDDRLVDSRAGKTLEESYTSSMAMAVFPIKEDTLGDCISYVHRQGTNVNFTIDRAKIREDSDEYDNIPIAIYLFANMPDLPATYAELNNKSFSFFMEEAYNNSSSIRRPQKGFPMVGSLGDNITVGADGNEFVLIPTEEVDGNTKIKLPLLNGNPSDYIPIPLKALYAKFSFAISVQPDQQIQEGTTPTFTLESYTLNNIPSQVYADSARNSNRDSVLSSPITTTVGTSITEGGSLEFDFYLPERFLTPKTSASDYNYPLGEDGAPIDSCYLQRFKPLLVDTVQKATYVTLNGYYSDHQNHNWEVNYDIYLGEDNYSDFNFYRNKNYINNVVIRGLKASKDQSINQNGVFIDHRVNVKRSLPIIINLQRETLLDAHYEVRPMRLRLVGENIPSGKSATVKILNKDGSSDSIGWVRLEKSVTTGDDHITSGVSAGKRKFFTTDLVTNTLKGGTSVKIDNLNSTNQAVWIYADENISTDSREAIVRVTYDNSDSLDYKIVQHGLYKVTGVESKKDYYIERFEEYLYNFDSEDSYGQINEEGMPWGLNNVQLSYEHKSFLLNEDNEAWNNFVQNTLLPTDDFYIWKQDSTILKNAGIANISRHDYDGLHFTTKIAQKANFPKRTMAETTNSAVEYCYNRNKRQPDGSIKEEDIVWYLPSADELEDFIVPAYSTFKEFQDKYYWTSQPAYIKNIFYYEYTTRILFFQQKTVSATPMYIDNTEYARATKVALVNGKYDYVKSGLMFEPYNFERRTESGFENLGCFYEMPRWKDGVYDIATKKTKDDTSDPKKVIGSRNGDERYEDTKNGKKYFVHLGHLYDLIEKTENGEHGYHPRTNYNRVRCVRKLDGVQ